MTVAVIIHATFNAMQIAGMQKMTAAYIHNICIYYTTIIQIIQIYVFSRESIYLMQLILATYL